MVLAMPAPLSPATLPPDPHLATRARLAAGAFAALVLALAALVVAFAFSARHADRQFALASLSERQAAAVTRIAALAGAGPQAAPALDASLADYRALIAAETRLTGPDPRQRRELAIALRLGTLARDPAQAGAFRAMATAIDRQEADEVVQVRAALAAAGQRSLALAAALALVALACAACAGWLLWRSNRTLAAMVRARTARIEAVDASRRLFFAKASHELRTPVTGLRSAAEVALDMGGGDPAILRGALQQVVASAGFLGHRIDELLGLAGADDGQLVLAREAIDLGDIARQALAEAQPYAAAVAVALHLEAPDAPLPGLGDARWLRQALLAVIENGLKFAPEGSALAVCVSDRAAWVDIAVTDRGPGVVDADLPRIFDAYYQAEAGRQRGGSGLGLALARWVAERHGGSVTARNIAGGGCCIGFTLPREAA